MNYKEIETIRCKILDLQDSIMSNMGKVQFFPNAIDDYDYMKRRKYHRITLGTFNHFNGAVDWSLGFFAFMGFLSFLDFLNFLN